MKAIWRFLRTTLLGGIFFLLPLVLSVLVLHEAIHWLAKVVDPVARYISHRHVVLGMSVDYLLAVGFLVLVGFFAGLLGRTRVGHAIREKLENLILRRMPGYTLLRGLTGESEEGETKDFRSALLKIAPNKWQMAFIVERSANGWCTVFLPTAPSATSGVVQLVSSDQVIELSLPPKDLVLCIMKIGVGFDDLAGAELRKHELNPTESGLR